DVALAVVAVERPLVCLCRAGAGAGEHEHLAEVETGVALVVEHVRPERDVDRLAREPRRLLVHTPPREHLRLRLAPEELRHRVVLRAQVATLLCPRLGLVEPAELGEHSRERGRVTREDAPLTLFLEAAAARLPELGSA